MKVFSLLLLTGLSAMWAQPGTAPAAQVGMAPAGQLGMAPAAPSLPNIADEEKIAEFSDGAPITMGQFKAYIAALPPDQQQLVARDPATFLRSLARMRSLSQMAEKEHLDQGSPAREQLEFQRMYLLSTVMVQHSLLETAVEGPEISAYYDFNREKYKQVKVNAIYIAFGGAGAKSANSSKRPLSEAEAKAKAARLLGQIRSGADFAKLAREHSDDETSKAKDGYFATLNPSDNIPDALRTAVFQLQEGETSEPVRQENGFYLLRAEQVRYRPLAEVRDQIFTEVKNQKFQRWLDEQSKVSEPKVTNPAFTNGAGASK